MGICIDIRASHLVPNIYGICVYVHMYTSTFNTALETSFPSTAALREDGVGQHLPTVPPGGSQNACSSEGPAAGEQGQEIHCLL